MRVYELINPSDPYTFEAPNIEVAGVAAALLSTGFGAKDLTPGSDESSPVLFGWEEWLKDRGIDSAWVKLHNDEIAAALDSFLIGDPASRVDVEEMLLLLPEDKRKQWRSERQERRRGSMNRIGEEAYALAERLRNGQKAEQAK